MHEILFRAKRKDNGEWIYGFYLCLGGKHHYILTGKLDITTGHPVFERYEVTPETVGQYTGLTDRGGKMIFEDDIIKAMLRPLSEDTNYAIGKTVFEGGTYKIAVYKSKSATRYREYTVNKDVKSYPIENNFLDRGYALKIIGNIHDNPALLKERA